MFGVGASGGLHGGRSWAVFAAVDLRSRLLGGAVDSGAIARNRSAQGVDFSLRSCVLNSVSVLTDPRCDFVVKKGTEFESQADVVIVLGTRNRV